jgi:hypothetical protein
MSLQCLCAASYHLFDSLLPTPVVGNVRFARRRTMADLCVVFPDSTFYNDMMRHGYCLHSSWF